MSDPETPADAEEMFREGSEERALTWLDRLATADTETRKRGLRSVRELAETLSRSFTPFVEPLSRFLTDDDRAVRLTAAKLFVTLARAEPAAARLAVESLADRLGDGEEFYYVRARCAEALGYVAVESPAAVTDPDTLADLRIGLEFDDAEVKKKLAKALAYVALGDPSRLRYQVDSLATHLDDDTDLVRYHLTTALAAIGCTQPTRLADAADSLHERLTDESPYVRGRAAEALGLLAGDAGLDTEPDLDAARVDDPPAFLTDRLAFCRRQIAGEVPPDDVGTIASIRAGTDDAAAAVIAPETSACPHCGFTFAEDGPPMCPQCGAPR